MPLRAASDAAIAAAADVAFRRSLPFFFSRLILFAPFMLPCLRELIFRCRHVMEDTDADLLPRVYHKRAAAFDYALIDVFMMLSAAPLIYADFAMRHADYFRAAAADAA